MSYIFRLYNKDGYTQIDRNYRNLSFLDKQSVSIPKRASGNPVGGVKTVQLDTKTDVLAVKKLGNFGSTLNLNDVGLARMTPNSQGNVQTSAVGKTLCVYLNGNANDVEQVELYRFSPNFTKSDSTGKPYKRIYRDDGVLVFDAGRFPMRVVANFNGNIPYNQGASPEFTLYAPNSNRQYAVYCCKNPLHVLVSGGVARIGYLFFTQSATGDGRWRFDFWFKYDQLGGNSGNVDDKDPFCSVAIIDVTGH